VDLGEGEGWIQNVMEMEYGIYSLEIFSNFSNQKSILVPNATVPSSSMLLTITSKPSSIILSVLLLVCFTII